MGLSGLDFMTVAANFLDSYSRTRRADLDFKRDAGRQDQLISAERQYQSGVREGERAFQSQQASSARDFQRSESDREWGRGADARALQEQLQRQQLGMTTAQFEEWKLSAPGRKRMEELDIKAKEAQINQSNAQTAHYGRMGTGGGGGGGRAPNPNAVTPGERMAAAYEKLFGQLVARIPAWDPEKNTDVSESDYYDRAYERASAAAAQGAERYRKASEAPIIGPMPQPPDTRLEGVPVTAEYGRATNNKFNPGTAEFDPVEAQATDKEINSIAMEDVNRAWGNGLIYGGVSPDSLGRVLKGSLDRNAARVGADRPLNPNNPLNKKKQLDALTAEERRKKLGL